jgi:hypothetical protein
MQADDPDQTAAIEMDEPDTPRRPWQQRRYQVAAAAGVIAVLGAGALIAHRVGGPREHAVPASGQAMSQAVPSIDSSGSPSGPVPSPSPAPLPSLTESPAPRTRALTPGVAMSVVPSVSNSGILAKDHHTLRVVTARADLTGQRELAWAADAGHRVGTSRCTQNFRFSADTPAGERPTMLMCWRTSATKSVYAIVVDIDKRPSDRNTVQVINRVWSEMG